jgi:hypothetical protein
VKWLKDILSILLLIVLLVLAYQYYQKSGLFTPQIITVVEQDTIVVTKVDTVIKTDIVVQKIPVTVTKYDTIKDTIIVVLKDSSYYSTATFETKFEKIKVGAYAKSPVDSFTFSNYPKPVILNDTIRVKTFTSKEKLKWGLIGVVVGVLLTK